MPAQLSPSKLHIEAMLDRDTRNPSFGESSIVSGVQADSEHFGWSWTYPRAEIHFPLDQATDWNFTAKITAIEAVLVKTGPQTVTFRINGHLVKTLPLSKAGTVEVAFPVEPVLLAEPAKTTVTMETQPCLPQKEGQPLCILLQRIGFERDAF